MIKFNSLRYVTGIGERFWNSLILYQVQRNQFMVIGNTDFKNSTVNISIPLYAWVPFWLCFLSKFLPYVSGSFYLQASLLVCSFGKIQFINSVRVVFYCLPVLWVFLGSPTCSFKCPKEFIWPISYFISMIFSLMIACFIGSDCFLDFILRSNSNKFCIQMPHLILTINYLTDICEIMSG